MFKETLQQNGYTTHQIYTALSDMKQLAIKVEETEESKKKVILPYIEGTTNRTAKFIKNITCGPYSNGHKNQQHI